MSEAIEGKVAKILDGSNLIINVGSSHGVQPGLRLIVFAPGDEVVDPDTGESLGTWEAVKGEIVANHVQERISICGAAPPPEKEDQVDPSTRTLSAAMIADHMRTDSAQSRLNVNKGQIDGMPKVGPISVGDPVRSLHSP